MQASLGTGRVDPFWSIASLDQEFFRLRVNPTSSKPLILIQAGILNAGEIDAKMAGMMHFGY